MLEIKFISYFCSSLDKRDSMSSKYMLPYLYMKFCINTTSNMAIQLRFWKLVQMYYLLLTLDNYIQHVMTNQSYIISGSLNYLKSVMVQDDQYHRPWEQKRNRSCSCQRQIQKMKSSLIWIAVLFGKLAKSIAFHFYEDAKMKNSCCWVK